MSIYIFDRFVLNSETRELCCEGKVLSIQDLPLRLLIVLVEHSPTAVDRETLRDSLWPPGTFLDVEASLNSAVARLREALGDRAASPQFVETVPRRGYRFVASVTVEETGVGKKWLLAGLVFLSLCLVCGLWLRGSEKTTADRSGVSGPNAEQLNTHLVIGKHQSEKRTRDGLEKAIAEFQSVVALDPNNAEAYSGLAISYAILGIYDYWRPRDALEPAEIMSRTALRLDPESGEAHLAASLVAAFSRWDWELALSHSEQSIQGTPSLPEAWLWRGSLHSLLGRHDKGITSSLKALSLDPVSPVVNSTLAWQYWLARRYEEAVDQSYRSIDLDPAYYDHWDNLKWIELTLGKESLAVEAWIRAEEIADGGGEGVRKAFVAGGVDTIHWRSIERQLEKRQRTEYSSPYDLAIEYAALEELDDAMSWLELSFTERETDLIGLATDLRLDPLRSLDRFDRLLEKMAFPQDASSFGGL